MLKISPLDYINGMAFRVHLGMRRGYRTRPDLDFILIMCHNINQLHGP